MTGLIYSIWEEGCDGTPHVLGEFLVVHPPFFIRPKSDWPSLDLVASKLAEYLLRVLGNVNVNPCSVRALPLRLILNVRWEDLAGSSAASDQR